jgi:hypothetical protein
VTAKDEEQFIVSASERYWIPLTYSTKCVIVMAELEGNGIGRP